MEFGDDRAKEWEMSKLFREFVCPFMDAFYPLFARHNHYIGFAIEATKDDVRSSDPYDMFWIQYCAIIDKILNQEFVDSIMARHKETPYKKLTDFVDDDISDNFIDFVNLVLSVERERCLYCDKTCKNGSESTSHIWAREENMDDYKGLAKFSISDQDNIRIGCTYFKPSTMIDHIQQSVPINKFLVWLVYTFQELSHLRSLTDAIIPPWCS